SREFEGPARRRPQPIRRGAPTERPRRAGREGERNVAASARDATARATLAAARAPPPPALGTAVRVRDIRQCRRARMQPRGRLPCVAHTDQRAPPHVRWQYRERQTRGRLETRANASDLTREDRAKSLRGSRRVRTPQP